MSPPPKGLKKVSFPTADVIDASHSLIAVSSILLAVTDQYSHTGSLSVGAIIHAANVINQVIDKLGLVDVLGEKDDLPF